MPEPDRIEKNVRTVEETLEKHGKPQDETVRTFKTKVEELCGDYEFGYEITDVRGDKPKFDSWNVFVTGYILDDGEKKFEKSMKIGFIKGEGKIKDSDLSKTGKHYVDRILEDEDFTDECVDSVEREKICARDLKADERPQDKV